MTAKEEDVGSENLSLKPFVGKLGLDGQREVVKYLSGFGEVEHVTSCPAFVIWPVVLSRYY